jgi:transketolase
MMIKAIPVKNKLAKSPENLPLYQSKILNEKNEEIILSDPKAIRALLLLMNQHATIGGAAAHWGGPSAFAEMMSAVHFIMFNAKKTEGREWYEAYHFVNDAGHAENGIYALRANYGFDHLTFNDLKNFRSIESKLTGHGEAHLNPEGVFISNGPLGSGLPQAQGLAMADKILNINRTTICVLSDGGAMEGEARESFATIPGLAKKNKLNPFVLLISDNNTKLGGRIDADSFSMQPTFKSLETLGWKLIEVTDGNNLEIVYKTMNEALMMAKKDPTTPIAIVYKTIKGIGIKETENSASGGHGYPLASYDQKLISYLEELYQNEVPQEFYNWAQDILKNKPANPSKPTSEIKEKVQDGFARALIKAAKEGLPVFSLSSDLQSSTGVKAFHKEFPDRFIDLGIQESNMISSAIGLSKVGLIPIVDTFAQFGITKGNLPFIMAGLSEGPILAMFSHTGFQDAADGASHQATTYFAALAAIPHLTIINCSSSSEAENLMYQALTNFYNDRLNGKTPNSIVFFLGRENHPVSYIEKPKYEWKKAQVISRGSDLTIISAGPMLQKAIDGAKLLELEGVKATVINHSFINHIDLELLQIEINKTKGKVIIIEDHQIIGGLGQMVVHALSTTAISFKAKTLGIKGEFGQSAYKADQLYDRFELSPQGIKKAYFEF